MPNLINGMATVNFNIINPANGLKSSGVARIDTGADRSLFDARLIGAVGATQIDSIQIIGILGVPIEEPVYMVDINLGDMGYFPNAMVVANDTLLNTVGYDALLGIDVLKSGIFIYDGATSSFDLMVGIGAGPEVDTVPDWLPAVGATFAIIGGLGILGLLERGK